MTAAATEERLETLRDDIERTRSAMDATLDALLERLSPSGAVARLWSEVDDVLGRALGAVSDNPGAMVGAALMLGFAVGRLAGHRRR